MSLDLWRNLAIVWLALLCFIGMLIPLAAALFAVKGMHIAVTKTPGLLQVAQRASRQARTQVESTSHTVTEPLIRAGSRITGVQTRLARLVDGASSRSIEEGNIHE